MMAAIRPYEDADGEALVELWERCGLLRPWNDPARDIALACASPGAEIFLGEQNGRLISACLVGHDGHRGWLYYLATEPSLQGRGLGRQIVRHCEDWLVEQGVPKIQLMIRPDNLAARRFYQRIGYEPNDCALMQRWLAETGAPKAVEDARPDGRIEVTITYLEMTARPTLAPVALPHTRSAALLRAEQPTLSFYRFLYATIGAPWLWWERRALDDESLKAIIQDERVELYVLYLDGVPAGMAELDRRQEPDIDLAYFGLMPDFIGLGLGRYLLVNAVDIAWSHEPARLTVNTNTMDHPKALPLYQQCGFRPYQQKRILMDDPRLNGLIVR